MSPTYRFTTGAVLTDAVPVGYRPLRRAVDVGAAEELDRLGAAVLEWAVQRRSGIAVRGADGRDAPPVREGLDVRVAIPLVRLGAVRLEVAAPARVVRVLDGPDAVGFAYGTLPGHPEVGEESFVVRRVGARAVFELRALSRPAFPYALAPLAGRALQRRYTERYLRALLPF